MPASHPDPSTGPDAAALARALAFADAQSGALTGLMGRIVDIDSPSGDHDGIAAVRQELTGFLNGHGVAAHQRALPGGGPDALSASVGTGRPVLLLGHVDTVHPRGSAAQRPFRIENGRAYGPGAGDMKGGVAIMAMVLAALRASGADWPVEALFVPDEEIGSPDSRGLTAERAAASRAVLCLEGSRAQGTVVTRRAGVRMLALRVEGRAAHSSRPEEGANAILGMAALLQGIDGLNAPDAGIRVNAGLIRGGDAVNTVAGWCEAEICIRHPGAGQWPGILAKLEALLAGSAAAGFPARILSERGFPPLEENPGTDRLLAQFTAASRLEGMGAEPQSRAGASDAANAGAAGVPVLCGTGAISAGAHTPGEYAETASLLVRTRIVLRTIAAVMSERTQ